MVPTSPRSRHDEWAVLAWGYHLGMSLVRIRLVGINDVYSLAQFPRLATLVAQERQRGLVDVFLFTVAGDFLAPSLLSSLDGGRGMVECLNALGATHVTLGNHEDDLRSDDLLARLDELSAVVLLTNVPGFRGRHVVSNVVEAGAARLGLVGGVVDDPTLFRRLPFVGSKVWPTNTALIEESRRLRSHGCTAVIALTHQTLAEDHALRDTAIINFIHGGHEHDGHLELDTRTPIAKASMNATSVVVADLSIDISSSGAAKVSVEARLEPVASYAEAPAMKLLVERHLAQVRSLDSHVLMPLRADEVLSSAGARERQTSIGTLVCSRLRDALHADAALFNGGGLRGETERRDRLTYADLRDELPFDGEVVVIPITGAIVQDAVHYSRTVLCGTGGFLQVDDATTVTEENDLIEIANGPVEPTRVYRVAVVRQLLFGLDGIAPLVELARRLGDRVPAEGAGRDAKIAILGTFS